MANVAFVGETQGTGGIERVGRAVVDLLGEHRIQDFSPGTNRSAWPAQLLRVRRRISQFRPDVIFVDRAFFAPFALLATSFVRPRPRMVLWLHGSEVASRNQQRWKAAVLRRFEVLICSSRFTKHITEQNFPDQQIATRLVVINPGVDPVYWRRLSGETADLASRALEVLSVGRISTNSIHKGMDRVALAIGSLRRSGQPVHFTVVGDGPIASTFDRYAYNVTNGAYTRYASATDHELAAHYARARVLALPSVPTRIRDRTFIEGFGLVFLEAAACGTPSIGGTMSGGADAISRGWSGDLVTGSVESIESVLHDALSGETAWSEPRCRAWADMNRWESRYNDLDRAFFGDIHEQR